MQRTNKVKTATQSTIAAAVATGMIVIGGVAAAPAADLAKVDLADRETRLERALDVAEIEARYATLYDRANKLDIEPGQPATKRGLRANELQVKLKQLNAEVAKAQEAKAKAKARAERKAEARAEAAPADVSSPESIGVSQGTLESIAACESGGDPSAVSSNGMYRGKYQFDSGTWAAMGGSGDPAAASEAEQDSRAAQLYAQSGSSPWPVCG